jgi:transposase
MPPPAVDDQLWELIQPLLPRETRRFRHPGRRRLDNRKEARAWSVCRAANHRHF